VFTGARHLSLSWAQWIQSTSPNPISLRSNLMLSSHLHVILNQNCITVFTKARHWSISWASQIQSTISQPITVRLILIIDSYLEIVPSLYIFRSKYCVHFLFPPIRDFVPRMSSSVIWWHEYKLWSFSVWNFFQSPVNKIGVYPSAPCSQTLSLYYSLTESHQFSHQYTKSTVFE
jgi:hypothetical protein